MKKFLLGLLFIPIFVQAETRGVVATDCGKFIERDRGNDTNWKIYYQNSFLAYLSALEYYSRKNKLTGISNDSIYYSVLQICKDKPLQRIDDSLLDLYFNNLK